MNEPAEYLPNASEFLTEPVSELVERVQKAMPTDEHKQPVIEVDVESIASVSLRLMVPEFYTTQNEKRKVELAAEIRSRIRGHIAGLRIAREEERLGRHTAEADPEPPSPDSL